MQAIDHPVSKALAVNNPWHTLFILEDLLTIRKAAEHVGIKDSYVPVSWLFHDLEQKLIYKAKQLLSKSPLVIRALVVLSVDTLKRLTVSRRSICLPVKTVTVSQTMTVLGL